MAQITDEIQRYRNEARNFYRLTMKYQKEAENADDPQSRLVLQTLLEHNIAEMDRCNCFAVSLLLEHNFYAKDGKEFFDMHGLQVAEVASCLDMLLDGRVSQLRDVVDRSQTWQYLYLITGQGKHSRYGVPQIKNATVDHLTKRGLCFWSDEKNDGCLVVWIDKELALSSELR